MSFPPYPKYLNSGLDWLGKVPAHWERRRLGYYFTERREKVSDREFPPLSVTKGGIVPQLETAAKTDDGENRKRVCSGDFVINSRSDRQGSAGVSPCEGSVSLISTVLEPQPEAYGRFVHHLLRSQPFQQEYYRFGKGIVADLWSTNYSEMRNITLAMPPLREQIAIACFIDHETSSIDVLVGEQQRLVELLKEKRRAVIAHAVTKGLNPDAPMKASGVEWIGECPAHWEVGAIKRYFNTASGGTPDTAQQELYYGGNDAIPWVRTMDLRNDVLTEVEVSITERALQDTACSVLPAGTVMVAMYGGEGSVGKNGLLGVPAAINQAICGLLPSSSHDAEYAFRFVQFYRPYWMIGAESSRKDPNISQDLVRNSPILKPPRIEQADIVQCLRVRLSALDGLACEAERAVLLLHERRTALISAAVTGKIDVRHLADAEAA